MVSCLAQLVIEHDPLFKKDAEKHTTIIMLQFIFGICLLKGCSNSA
jgi:hypothetical protein